MHKLTCCNVWRYNKRTVTIDSIKKMNRKLSYNLFRYKNQHKMLAYLFICKHGSTATIRLPGEPHSLLCHRSRYSTECMWESQSSTWNDVWLMLCWIFAKLIHYVIFFNLWTIMKKQLFMEKSVCMKPLLNTYKGLIYNKN